MIRLALLLGILVRGDAHDVRFEIVRHITSSSTADHRRRIDRSIDRSSWWVAVAGGQCVDN
jgi:hypothetical protein